MLSEEPVGQCAGWLDVTEQGGGWRVSQPDAAGAVWFGKPALAARALLHATMRLFMQARPDLVWLHAAVVARGGRAYVFPAASGQGKSTLVAELLDRGWHYLSDEVAPIDPASRAVLPFAIAPHRRVGGGRVLAEPDVQRLPKVRVRLAPGVVGQGALAVAGVGFLTYCPDPAAAAARLVDCPPGAAVLQMLRHSFGDACARPAELDRLCAVMSRVPALHLRYASARKAADLLERSVVRPQA